MSLRVTTVITAGASSRLSAVLVAVETSALSSFTRSRSSMSGSAGSSASAGKARHPSPNATTAAAERFLMIRVVGPGSARTNAPARSRPPRSVHRRGVHVHLEQSVLVVTHGEGGERVVPGVVVHDRHAVARVLQVLQSGARYRMAVVNYD